MIAAVRKLNLGVDKRIVKDEVKNIQPGGTSSYNQSMGSANFPVDAPSQFKGEYIVNLLKGKAEKTFKVGVQLWSFYAGGGSALKAYGPTYEVEITAIRKDNQVRLYIPAISMTIPPEGTDSSGNLIGGDSYLMVTGPFIPNKFRPTTVSAVSFSVSSNVTGNPMYQGSLYRQGSFRYALPGGEPIPVGQLVADATWVDYLSNPYFVPNNYLASTWGRSNVILPTLPNLPPTTYPYTPPPPAFTPGTVIDYQTRYGGYYEYNYVVFNNGKIYLLWGDNSHTPTTVTVSYGGTPHDQIWPGLYVASAFSTFDVKSCEVKQDIAPYYPWGPNQGNFFQSESAIAVNPLNPNIVVLSLSMTEVPFYYGVSPLASKGVAYMYSTDGGKTFTEYTLFYPGYLGIKNAVFGYDQALNFDRFGNLWFTALAADPQYELPLLAYTFVSPMGDPNGWILVYQYGVSIGAGKGQSVDYPRSKVGPGYPDGNPTTDGKNPESYWTAMFLNPDSNPSDINVPTLITGFQIYGPVSSDPNSPLGVKNVSPAYQFQPPATTPTKLQDLLIDPNGGVLLISSGGNYDPVKNTNGLLSSGVNYDVLCCFYNPKGTSGNFNNVTRWNIGYTAMGRGEPMGPMSGGAGQPYDHIPEQRMAGVVDRSGGKYNGRYYVVYVDKKEITSSGYSTSSPSNKQTINLTWSDDAVSWAEPIQINNDLKDDHSHFNPCMDIDQTTGKIVIAFYDARTCPGNHQVNQLFAIITPEDIEKVEKMRKCSA